MPALRPVVSRENFVNSEWNGGGGRLGWPGMRVYLCMCANARSLIKIGIKSGTVEKMGFPSAGGALWQTAIEKVKQLNLGICRFVKLQAEGIKEAWRVGDWHDSISVRTCERSILVIQLLRYALPNSNYTEGFDARICGTNGNSADRKELTVFDRSSAISALKALHSYIILLLSYIETEATCEL